MNVLPKPTPLPTIPLSFFICETTSFENKNRRKLADTGALLATITLRSPVLTKLPSVTARLARCDA